MKGRVMMRLKQILVSLSGVTLGALLTTGSVVAQAPQAKVFAVGAPQGLAELPPGRTRSRIESLPPAAQQRALEWLQRFSFPESDLEYLQVDSEGGIHYADTFLPEGAPDGETTAAPQTEAIAPTDTFLLHSRPGSSRVVYLDFDGHTITGTAWNSGTHDPLYAKAYDLDGDPDTFNSEERNRIGEIWHRVAEDFAPFDIDVTTEEPASFGPYTGRLLITHSIDTQGRDMPYSYAGGVAYVGVWGYSYYDYYSPALVYYDNLGGGYPTYVAEAASHEFGHNLNLSHDGRGSPYNEGYYQGHGSGYVSWAPIMGVGYYKNVTQWSKGEYDYANNTQDDIAIIGSQLTTRLDDHGNTLGSATPLLVDIDGFITSTNPETDPHNAYTQNKGVIESQSDVDLFSYEAGTGPLSISVMPAWDAFYRDSLRGANLDIEATLYDQDGAVIATSDSSNDTYATIATTVSAGNYYLAVTGVGNTSSPYSDYGSLGQYFIVGGITPPTVVTDPPLAPTALTATTVSHNRIDLSWSDNADNENGFRVERSLDQINWAQITQLPQNSTSHSDTGLAPSTTYYYRLLAYNTAGDSGYSNVASDTTMAQPLPPAAPSNIGTSDGQDGTATITWVDNSDNETNFEVQREKRHKKRDIWQENTLVGTTGADATSYTDASGTGTFRYRVRAINGVGASDWSAWSEVTVTDSGSGGGGGDKPCRGKKCQ
jgi:hypothetical protein